MSTNKKLEALHANLKGTYELPDYDTFAKDLTDTVKSKAFFETLSNDGFDMPPDYDTFAKDLTDTVKSKAFFETLSNDGFDMPPDYDTFVSDLGLKKKEPGEFGLPSKDVISQMFGNIAKDSLPVSTKPSEEELSQEVATDPKQFDTPDLSLESPEFKGPEQNNLSDAVSRITYESIGKINFKEQVTNRISDIDKEIAALPQDNTEMLPSMNFSGGLILPTRPVSDEKARLLKEKDDLKLAITTPSKLDYVLGKAYNQTIVGLADAIINGEPRANEEWLSKYDSNTLTDVTATALSFLGDSWFFGGMGKVGGSIGKAAAKPIVNKMMTKGVEKLVTSGIEEKLAKELVLKGAARITQGAMSMSSSGTALGSYSAVGDALGQWSQPDANFDDIKFSQSLSAGLKSTVLGIGVGGIGLASAAVASKASAIPGTAARVGAKVGVAAGGLTAESALFAGGGAAMEGEPLTMQAFSETVLLLAMLKGQRLIGKVPEIVTDPKKAAVKLYKSLQYDPKKPGEGQFEVDIKPWELEAIGAKEYKETMDILSKDDKVLADILNSEKVPALLKQKLLWGSRGVGMEDVNLLADKVVQNGEMTELYNKEGLLVDVQKARSPAEAQQDAMETGLQLEDNKMRTQAASLPVEDKIGVSKKLKEKGIDEAKLLAAVDKPVNERTPEESKMVGDYWSMIPKKEIKPEENPFTKEEVSTPEDIAKELEVDYKGVQKNEEGEPSLDLYNVKVGKESEATFAVKSGATKEEVLAKRDETTAKWKPEKPAVEETPAEVKKETVKTVEKKLDRQKIVKDDKIFKEQKNQLIDDLTAAEDILLGKNKDFAREKESEMPPDLKDSLMKTNYEHEDLNNLPPDVIKKLNKLGIRVKDGNLIVDIYKDGSLEVGDIRTALGIVKKGFPAKTPAIKTGVSGPTNPKAREFRTVAESYGSLSEAERRVKVAEENLSQSKQEGRTKKVGDKTVPIEVNKKLVATMQEQLTLAKSIHEEAKNVGEEGYNRIAKQKKMDADKEFGAFWDEFKDHFGYNDVRREQVYDAIEKQGRPKDLTYDTVQPLVMKEALGVEKKTIEQKRSDIEQRLVKNELELKDKYGRKDGGGLRKPKNNREEWEQRTLNNAIEKDRSNLIDLEKYEPAIKKLNEEKTIDKPDSTEGTGKGDKLPPSAKGDKAGVTDKGEAKPSEEVKSEVKKEPSKEQGVKFKDKNYQSVDAVLDAIDKGEITFDESKQLREDVAKFEEGLKAEAKKNSEKIAGKIKISTGEAETDIKKNAEDQGKLRMRFLPPDIISRGNTALWKQLIKPRDAIADWIAGKLQQGGQSQIDALRWTSKTVTNWFGGLGRTERDILGKLRMSGTVKEFAPYEASQVSKQLLKIVNSDPESLRRVRDALDPEIATEKLVYGDLTVAEKNLYSQLRELNTWVHETNYANGFIDSETYLKFKDVTGDSKYIARMYDVYTLPKEVADMVNNNRTKKKTNALELDMFKAREEVDEWKKDHAITDPVYLTTKRVMQTIQNAAVKEYMDQTIADHPDFVQKVKKGEVPKGFRQLSGSYKWGPFRNKAVANHIVEDFTGFFYASHLTDMSYDVIKMYDKTKLRQFYKKFFTVYNPFVQTGNYTGNLFFASIAGVNPSHLVAEQVKLGIEKPWNKGTAEYKSLLKAGIMGRTALTTDFTPVTPENRPVVNGIEKANGAWKRIAKAFGWADEAATKLYQGADNIAKYAAYRIFRKQGLSHEVAIRRVYDSFQNYTTVGKTWDVASKMPVIGNPFVKFQADLQRIIVNGMTTSPMTTIGTLMMIKLLGNIASNLSGETDEEKELREGRKGVAKIPGVNIPLSFKVGKKEVNVARYLSPLYLYTYSDSDMDALELSKFLPFQLQKIDKAQLGETRPGLVFGDPVLGVVAQVIADRDFRSASIQTPSASKYHNPNITTEERIGNVMDYVARTNIPFYKSVKDIYAGMTGQLDYYGRKRTWSDAILNNLLKIQEYDKPELKRYVEGNIGYLTNRFAALSSRMGDANSEFLRTIETAKEQGLEEEAIGKLYEVQDKVRAGRLQKSLDEQIPVLEELSRITDVYKKWYPSDPFLQENFMDIESGKNQRFNVMDDIDLQKKYKGEYNLLKSNGLLRRPTVPSYKNGKALTEAQRKRFLNVYWSEYVRYLDNMIGLTEEEFREKKDVVVKSTPSKTKPTPDKYTMLDAYRESAAMVARQQATIALEYPDSNQ